MCFLPPALQTQVGKQKDWSIRCTLQIGCGEGTIQILFCMSEQHQFKWYLPPTWMSWLKLYLIAPNHICPRYTVWGLFYIKPVLWVLIYIAALIIRGGKKKRESKSRKHIKCGNRHQIRWGRRKNGSKNRMMKKTAKNIKASRLHCC